MAGLAQENGFGSAFFHGCWGSQKRAQELLINIYDSNCYEECNKYDLTQWCSLFLISQLDWLVQVVCY